MSKSITGLRIKDGVLQVSYDNGCHYEDIGQVGGADGKDGTNGSVCTIDPVTKHWHIDGVDTGVLAEGVDGINGNDGIDGMDGIDGIPYSIIAAPGENIAVVGTPSVSTSSDSVTKTTTFTFNYLKGEKGDKGENGEQGSQGEQGPSGPQGIPGNGINFKSTAEGCTAPNDGYINENGELLVKDSNSTFINYGSLKGPQGNVGPKGNQGNPVFFTANGTYNPTTGLGEFYIEGAVIGDCLIYTGTDTRIAPQGQLYKLTSAENDVQVWQDQNFNIRGPKGDSGEANISDLDFDALVDRLHGYPLYTQGNGIDILPNSRSEYIIKALVDNNTIKFDSEGRMYTPGVGTGSDTVVVTYYNTASTEGMKISTILNRFFGTSELMSNEQVKSHEIVQAGLSAEQANNILRGNTKNVIIKVPGERSFINNESLPMFIPATIINDNFSIPSDSCLLFGVGYKAQVARVVNSTSSTVTQEISSTPNNLIGLSPVLYCINLIYDDVLNNYQFYGFVIYPVGNFGLFGGVGTV